MKRRTLRGQFTEGTTKRLVVDDGRLNNGYRITQFVVSGEPSSSANDAYATLSLDPNSPLVWDWSDNRQIAWASTNIVSTSGANTAFELVDPNHVVLQDLYIQGQVSTSGGTAPINYLVVLEPISLSDDEAILTLIKERSQNVD
jgi:hypothetical protein